MNWFTWIYHKLFHCKRRMCPHAKRNKPLIPPSSLPWFWIGAQTLNETTNVTDIINSHIERGTIVTAELLSELTYIDNINVIWKYVDAETLEEKEFPLEGIVIR